MSKAQDILKAVGADPDRAQDDIAKEFKVTPSYVSKVLSKSEDLEIEKGLTFKLDPPKDKTTGAGPSNDDEGFKCGACGHGFNADFAPGQCPSCGVEFE